mgnify:CR=1 FL=1
MNRPTKIFKESIHGLADLFFPRLCLGCDIPLHINESDLCFSCQLVLPKTDFHRFPENPAWQNFIGRVDVLAATSFLHFEKGGTVQRLMHAIKYQGKKELAHRLGYWFGEDLKDSRFSEFNRLIPIPLHPKKLKQRGYNQAEAFAEGISRALSIPLDTDSFVRVKHSKSQTGMDRFLRWNNVQDAFELRRSINPNEKILLIDDVLTSGATFEAAMLSMIPHGLRNFGLATLAYAQ